MEFNQSLFDIIGTVICFLCIILLLSIVVTSLVQTFQAAFHLRGRNLKRGLQSIIQNVFDKEPSESNKLALQVLNAKRVCLVARRKNPTSLWNRLLGPAISYINPKFLPEALNEVGLKEAISDKATKEEVLESFNRIWNQMENRFLLRIRFITLACAIVVAGYFQISTPALLSKLSTNERLRTQIMAYVEGKRNSGSIPKIENVSESALARLEAEFPDMKEKIEEAGGVGGGKESLVAELEAVLEGMGEKKDEILKRYNELLNGLYAEQKEAAEKQIEASIGTLTKFNITGWPEDWDFYYRGGFMQWSHIVGVLMTAILLSLGAPFWFERLKDAVKLKDVLSNGIKNGDDQ